MAKYGKKIVDKIIALIKDDNYTIAEICQQVGINPCTYHEWKNLHEEFRQAIEAAEVEQMQSMVKIAKNSLKRKLQGYDVTETRVVSVPGEKDKKTGETKPKIKEQITTKKHVAADTAAIIFTLTNGDPEHWRNRQSTEVTGKDGKDLFAQKTDEELDKAIEELKRKLE